VAGDDQFKTIAAYVERLCQEILATPAESSPLQTVFFGGGTPSLLQVDQLDQILATIDRHIGISTDAEISMEIDPGTFDLAKVQGYKTAGVNRISLGVQSFQAERLIACGRTHTPDDIDIAIDLMHRAGVSNFSLDLISGLPGLTLEQWHASLQAAIALAPSHLSIYDLTIEPGTAFGRWYQPGVEPLPSDETTVQMYRLAQQLLTAAGYEHYEISNYARSGYQCQHNRVYWENRPYYGFGMAAASYLRGQRFTRPRKRSDYDQWVQNLAATGGTIDCPITSLDERLLDTLMLGLRLADGLRLDALAEQFGVAKITQILTGLQPYYEQGWVTILDQTGRSITLTNLAIEARSLGHRVRLSDPDGFLFSNVVLAALFSN
jgi:oxygen-independent coproporphyrinogen-3 oxidase